MTRKEVMIVGAGPGGLATSACLNMLNIPNILVEKKECYAHMWKKTAYDRLKLHLAKEFCFLPHMPHPYSTATYIPKDQFVHYLDSYVKKFNINPQCNTNVEFAAFDEENKVWVVKTKKLETNEEEEVLAKYLVVATGENAQGIIPNIEGLEGFSGKVLHSSQFRTGNDFLGKRVLVVGCGNSGMEIAYDLCNHGALTSISIRSPFHVCTKELIRLAMFLLKYLPMSFVDKLIATLSYAYYGDLSKYGIVMPSKGPFALKFCGGRSPVIDVGTVQKIKNGEIQVVKEPVKINGDEVLFSSGASHFFDAIIFATGYTSSIMNWLKDDEGRWLNKDGYPKEEFPNQWKGKNGLYFVGFAKRGLAAIASDSKNVANDIARALGQA